MNDVKINKESSMLIDMQYVRPDRKNNLKDYLYIIWKDLSTGEKHLRTVEEPQMDIYFEKPELRTHAYNKNYERLENLEKKTVKYKDIIFAIADDIGPKGKEALSNAFQTRNFEIKDTLMMYPYVFGADYNVASWYRIQWLNNLSNNIPKKLNKGFLDIEVDGYDVPGMPSPVDCPINAVTLIDETGKSVYTFLLTHREFVPLHMGTDDKRKKDYEHMYQEQEYMQEHQDELIAKLHETYDESYGDLDYKLYFYKDERKMLVHLWQLINTLKLDFIGIWNIAFDIPYIIERLKVLGYDPKEVMCHPDFPNKQCYFKEDTRNFDIKNKSDNLHLSSYTTFYDQMELYAAIRKGMSELRSYKLNYIAQVELNDTKLDYSDDGDIKTLPYMNYEMFVIYNIKDVLLQLGIERKTTDFDTLYVSSYENATSYDKVFKQTVVLRNVQYSSYLKQGLVPGQNINIYNTEDNVVESQEESDDDDDDTFEGALVANPKYMDYVGAELYGRPTNNIFHNGVDFDMGAFYPNTIAAMNIDPSTLIFKAIMPINQYDLFDNGKMKFRGITGKYFSDRDDGAKECMDNIQTQNYMTCGTKWFNMPDVSEVYDMLKKKLK